MTSLLPSPEQLDILLSHLYSLLFTQPSLQTLQLYSLLSFCLFLLLNPDSSIDSFHSLTLKLLLIGTCVMIGTFTFLLNWRREAVPPLSGKGDWSKQLVVVTGGSHGIGLGLVHLLLKAGASIAIIDRLSPIDLPQPSGETQRINFFKCDVSSPTDVSRVAGEILRKFGGRQPTMIVNNAGIVIGKKVMDASIEEMERTIKVNLLGHFYILKSFLPSLLSQGSGHILAVGSVMGLTGAAHAVDYCASKFGVTGYMESLRQEVGPLGIKVSTIYPGLIDTGMFQGVSHQSPYLTPKLSPSRVSQLMFDILASQRSQERCIPFYARFTPLLRMLPPELVDWAHEVTGANKDLAGRTHSISEEKLKEAEGIKSSLLSSDGKEK